MKCIHCGRTSRLRERTDGRCPGCQHRFAFDPEARPGAGTDAEFKDAIDRVSGGGQLRFTARQLWLAANAPTKMPPPPSSGCSSIVLFALGFGLPVAVLALALPGLLFMAFLAAAAGAAVGAGAAKDEKIRYADLLRPRGPFETFRRYQLTPWLKVHGEIPGLLPPRDPDAAAPQVPADADALAVDRAVVTDRWETAQMLLANGFDREHDCAVLSRDGYPDGTADTVRQALRRNPRLTVFALHDASPDGCQLPLDLREPEWFPDPSVRVVDLGVRPETVRRLKLPWLSGSPAPSSPAPSLPVGLYDLLVYEDRRWLDEGYVYELATVPSAELMRAVSAGMAAAGPNDGSGGTPAYDDAFWAGVAAWFGSVAGGRAETVEVDRFGRPLSGAHGGPVDPPLRLPSSYVSH